LESSSNPGVTQFELDPGCRYSFLSHNRVTEVITFVVVVDSPSQGNLCTFVSAGTPAVWKIVLHYAQQVGIERLAPHDLRRTCAKLCRKSGGDLEQIQFLLGHSSIQTTEKYLGGERDIVNAVNDRIFARVKKFQKQ
jgi:integrase